MAAIYSTNFFTGNVTATGDTTLFEVPTGYVVVLRDLRMTPYSAAPGTSYFIVAGALVFSSGSAPAEWATYQSDCRIVLPAGAILQFGNGGGSWSVSASGYLLSTA